MVLVGVCVADSGSSAPGSVASVDGSSAPESEDAGSCMRLARSARAGRVQLVMARAVKLIPALLVVPLAIGCGTHEPPPPSEVVASGDEPGASEPRTAVRDGVPRITSDAAVHDFGAIKPTDSVEHVFGIRNAGSADLKLERVQPT